jgi:hypothetical protein
VHPDRRVLRSYVLACSACFPTATGWSVPANLTRADAEHADTVIVSVRLLQSHLLIFREGDDVASINHDASDPKKNKLLKGDSGTVHITLLNILSR